MNKLQQIQSKIHESWGQGMLLDSDLAALYGVETRVLNQAVKRNIERFPRDFMFQLTKEEWNLISSQFVMTSRAKRPKSALPLVFTEHGALMLASVLKSDVAIDASILITRAFVAMRQTLVAVSLLQSSTAANIAQLRKDFEELKLDIEDILHDQNDINEETRAQLDAISDALTELQKPSTPAALPEIGYTAVQKQREKASNPPPN